MKQFRIKNGSTHPLGATVLPSGIQFSAVVDEEDAGIVLIEKNTDEHIRIPFSDGQRVGNIASVIIENISAEDYFYKFYRGTEEYVDPYTKRLYGNEVWGSVAEESELCSGIVSSEMKEIRPLCIPYNESVFYCLHVRGFTRHASSKCKKPGTFRGIIEKREHLKKLGVTGIELMPAYEFEEFSEPKQEEVYSNYKYNGAVSPLNYWGYKAGYYFAPKASYASGNPVEEFKAMVNAFHESGMEVIMQFYFPDTVKQGFILDVIKYWVCEYHIDGVHLKGNKIPITLLGTEPLLSNTKIMYDYIPVGEIYDKGQKVAYPNLCVYQDDFMYSMRRFLKGDEDMLGTVTGMIRRKSDLVANVNFITNYYGFTLNDLVSYDVKHNEDNGEDNRDGADYNYSWNCGVEGKTKKAGIVSLRKKMIKNALLLVFLSQGTPLINAGDEFCNSQNGNNNPYCQDNDITWIQWKRNKMNEEITDFISKISSFRKSAFFLNRKDDFTMMDVNHCGYPDLSYHGEEAWKSQMNNYHRHLGILYADSTTERKPALCYVAYNMHWESKTFCLPAPPKKKRWQSILATGSVTEGEAEHSFKVEGRSISVFMPEEESVEPVCSATGVKK